MAKSQESYNKKQKEKKRQKKNEEKKARREERKEQGKSSFEDMIAYVDEFGNPTDTPPDPTQKEEIEAEDIELGIPKKEKTEDDGPERSGTVDFFNHDKGFGFIKGDNTHEKYFVHVSNVEEDIDEGQRVSFELEQGPRGLNAVRVKREEASEA